MSKENNSEVSMNSVFLETFRKRKNEILAAEICLDGNGNSTGSKMTGNSVFLETFRRRKNSQLASELGISTQTGAQTENAVPETVKGSDTSEPPKETVSHNIQSVWDDTELFSDPDFLEIMDNSTELYDDRSGSRYSAGSNERLNPAKSDTNSYELTGSQARSTSTPDGLAPSSFRHSSFTSRTGSTMTKNASSTSGSASSAPKNASSTSGSVSSATKNASSTSGFPATKKDNSGVKKNNKNNTKKNAKIAVALSLVVIAVWGVILLTKTSGDEVPVDDPIDEPISFVSPGDADTESDEFHESTLPTGETTATTTTTSMSTTDTTDSTTSSTPDFEFRDIRPGEKNDDVKRMQQRLAELGYMSTSSCTGFYGDYTKKRIKLFQNNAGLKATGIADVETLKRLFADDAPVC